MDVQGEETNPKRSAAANPAAGHETELKLLADPETIKLLMAAPVLAREAGGKGVVRRLEATYFDTSDCTIARHGGSLRVRRSGRKHIQTLKLPGGDNPLARRELEAAVPGMHLHIEQLPFDELGSFGEALNGAELAPVFSTKVRRVQQLVSVGDAQIEAAFDEGVLIAGDRTENVCEVELELKEGEVGAVYELALSLLGHAPLRIGYESKAERGYRLAFGTTLAAEKSAPSEVAPDATVDEALATILQACFHHVLANLPLAERGEHPEGVHQLRVALRRLRSIVTTFKKEVPASALIMLGTDAKRLSGALGPPRNWDVFATTTIGEIADAGLDGIDFAALRAALAPFRAHSYETARLSLGSVECTRFLLSLGRLIARRSWRNDVDTAALAVLTEPARDFAGRALARLHRKALKQGRHLHRATPAARHSLRITLKKLRYATDFFLPLYPDADAGKLLRRLKQMQDILGADNDVTTTQSLLQDIELASTDLDAHRAIGAIKGWQARDRIEATAHLEQSWRKFADVDPFWG